MGVRQKGRIRTTSIKILAGERILAISAASAATR